MTQRTNIYGNLHIADFAYVSEYDHKDNSTKDWDLSPVVRVSPGIGIEYKTLKRLSFYAEINNLANVSYIPYSFSVGIKYDIGKITRNYIDRTTEN